MNTAPPPIPPTPTPDIKWFLFSFKGRIGRRSFTLGALLLVLVFMTVIAMAYANGTPTPSGGRKLNDDMLSVVLVFIFMGLPLNVWAILAMTTKRLHDIGFHGIFSIAMFLWPAVPIVFAALAIIPGSRETNRYGPPPFGSN